MKAEVAVSVHSHHYKVVPIDGHFRPLCQPTGVTMRSTLPFVLSLLAGCSEYNLAAMNTEKPTAPASNSNVTGDEPETNEHDVDTESTNPAVTDEPVDETGPEADGECGFHLENGPMDEAFTQTYLSYQLLSAKADLINPGEPMTLSFTVTANECGDAEIVIMQFAINDEVDFDEWLVEEYNEQASIEDDSGFTFDPAAANGIVLSKELHFTWSDGFWELGYDNTGYMDTVFIPAGESVTLTFQFVHTELGPIDAIADLMLSTIIWRDVGTEQEVQGWNDGHADMRTTFQFIE